MSRRWTGEMFRLFKVSEMSAGLNEQVSTRDVAVQESIEESGMTDIVSEMHGSAMVEEQLDVSSTAVEGGEMQGRLAQPGGCAQIHQALRPDPPGENLKQSR